MKKMISSVIMVLILSSSAIAQSNIINIAGIDVVKGSELHIELQDNMQSVKQDLEQYNTEELRMIGMITKDPNFDKEGGVGGGDYIAPPPVRPPKIDIELIVAAGALFALCKKYGFNKVKSGLNAVSNAYDDMVEAVNNCCER